MRNATTLDAENSADYIYLRTSPYRSPQEVLLPDPRPTGGHPHLFTKDMQQYYLLLASGQAEKVMVSSSHRRFQSAPETELCEDLNTNHKVGLRDFGQFTTPINVTGSDQV